MVFESFVLAQLFVLGAAFVLALLFGLVANKTHFCTMGAVSDWVNMGDTGRLRAWVLAMALALLGVSLLEWWQVIDVTQSFPPYRGSQLMWAENLFGGLMFGIGMTLASGCGNKTLVRIGGGNLKSLLVFGVLGTVAYFMIYPFPGTDNTLFSMFFYPWLRPLAVDLGHSQELTAVLLGEVSVGARVIAGIGLALLLLLWVFANHPFRTSFDHVLSGVAVGLLVLAAWWLTGVVRVDVSGEAMSLVAYAQDWDFLADSAEGRPAEVRSLAVQSFTFINPSAQAVGYLAKGMAGVLLTFGVVAVFGVIFGSLLWALWSRRFRLEWFADFSDFMRHLVGAVLMGIGGVLAVGCTIGQGVAGVSTLAVGSFLALFAIVFGAAMTMRIQYYRLVYEGEAGWVAAFLNALVDFRIIPSKFRKLNAI